MTANWIEYLETESGLFKLYYSSAYSWHYPYLVEQINP